MPWSHVYKPPNSNITYDVSNTCCFDTQLQMVYYIWFRGFLPHLVVNKDPLLLEALNNIRKGNSAKARHDLMIGRSVPVKVAKEGNIERWNCWGQLDETKPYPELFRSPGKMHLIWGHCSKMGENCPLHKFFQKKELIGKGKRSVSLPIAMRQSKKLYLNVMRRVNHAGEIKIIYVQRMEQDKDIL